jgi:hypothetical protein
LISQLHSPITLFPGKYHWVPIKQEVGLASEAAWILWRKEKYLPQPEIEPLSFKL